MRPVNEIIVHCTATPEGRPVTVSEIDRWHRQRGWSGIGYHRVIGLNGERWQGRALEKIGAHCEGHNIGTIGVAYVGGLSADGRDAKDTRTPAQREALLAELIDLRDLFNILKVSGHREYANKACPSFNASGQRTRFRIATGHKRKSMPSSWQIAAIPDPLEREAAMIDWQDTQSYQRDYPMINQIGAALGLPEEQIDALWLWSVRN
ncbi:N-acetylmuramoyl-L-alanine amidase [Rhizobium sp. Root149]|uniref:N-acetylmuramoyl-L-alanine amidase n=1 Tax=Rhizobium sp. Root149 TaxID=1736473 RepID=UPI0009E678B3|nr:N-acetylmuramoyl-L-alanine amidase [Rhizobium sp. Root149]